MRRLLVMLSLLAALALPAAAHAADPLGLACADQGDGIRLCQGKVKTFDGVALDANVALPAGSDLPLAVLSHGYGGAKVGYADLKPWAQRGYATLAFSARGFGASCGSAASRLPDPVGCAQGWVHLDDVRYEARDIQQLAGLLADAHRMGWTDDLFPVDEAVRYCNRTRGQYPDAPLALMFLDFGHQRGQNKGADVARFERRAYAWKRAYAWWTATSRAPRTRRRWRASRR